MRPPPVKKLNRRHPAQVRISTPAYVSKLVSPVAFSPPPYFVKARARIASLRFTAAPRKAGRAWWLFVDASFEFMLMNESMLDRANLDASLKLSVDCNDICDEQSMTLRLRGPKGALAVLAFT
jgi:hypothetical protein